MRWPVSTLEQGFLLTVSLTDCTVLVRYTASAYLTPKKHRAKVSRLLVVGHMDVTAGVILGWLACWVVKRPWSESKQCSVKATVEDCFLGQIAGVSSTEFGLSAMIWAAIYIGKVRIECQYRR